MNRPPRRDQGAPGGRSGRGGQPGPRPGDATGGQNIGRVRPVYREAREALRGSDLPATANTGLLYDRYADIWSGDEGNWKPLTPQRGDSARLAFLKQVRKQASDAERTVRSLLDAWHARRAALWQAQGAQVIDLVLAAPLASGLGMTHALDVGFVWDRNLGVPFLPASSLKGAVRVWATQWSRADPATIARIFGDRPDNTEDGGGAGAVIFHALYPVTPPKLRLDVMNPHFSGYYQEGKPPTDSLGPNPVFFLTVPAGTRFRTALQPRAGAVPGDLEQATQWLREALEGLGLGAKTAVGYGLFQSSG